MLSATSSPSVTQHTNEFSVPHAIRSASSPSASLPAVDHSRATSLDLDPPSQTHSLSTSPSFPLHAYPRSSILINARQRPYKGVIYANPALVSGSAALAAPVVSHIPAVPSRREREKERERAREREKERERERERAKNKDDEKIWGIPKKALLLGLGDLNFNAQMAMMAGWGHGSGGASILPSTAVPSSNDRKRIRPSTAGDAPRSAPSSITSRRSANDDSDDDADTHRSQKQSRRPLTSSGSGSGNGSSSAILVTDGAHSSSSKKASSNGDASAGTSPTEERMDPEELAALNAIINTRRSMAAAQALVSGQIGVTPRSARGSSFGGSTHDLSRPPLEEKRFESQESVPSMSSMAHSSTSFASSNLPTSPSDRGLQPPPSLSIGSGSTILEAAEIKSPRIRFAPLPTPASAPPYPGKAADSSLNGHPAVLVEDSEESDTSDSDFDSDDESKSMKGKWYLMGMPSAYFKPQYYTSKSSRRRHSKSNSTTGLADADDNNTEDGHSLRRKSTGSLSDGTSIDTRRKAASENDDEERGRSGASASKSTRKSSHSRRRSRSRTGAISSGDEDERARRRELIRLARPGGTGMVTLPDGTKIRARRVNDQPSQEEPEFIEWGFAGLAREASRRSLGGSGPPSLATTPNSTDHKGLAAYMEAEQDEEDDGSGMAWVRRRRREREARARKEREDAERAAAEAQHSAVSAAVPPSETSAGEVDHADASLVSSDVAPAPELDPAVTPPVTATVEVAAPTESAQQEVSAVADEPMPLSINTKLATTERPTSQALLPASDQSHATGSTFDDAAHFVASPTSEEPPVGLESSVLSEASNADSAMTRSQTLSKPARGPAATGAMAGDVTPRQNTGLGLTADKAEEIRRRHEDEVAALGAEVLAQTRRNNQRRQASASAGRGVASPNLGGEDSSAEREHATPAKSTNRISQPSMAAAPAMTGSASLSKSASRDAAYEKKSISRAVGSIMRKATTDSDKTVRTQQGHASLNASADESWKRHDRAASSPAPAHAAERVHYRESSAAAAAVTSPTTLDGAAPRVSIGRSASPESTLSRQSSAVGYAASTASKSASSLHGPGGSTHASSPMSTKRMTLDPSVSTPVPSPWLPRRPDARGVSVVPLPQLGVRPERPREGRVWQSDDSDADDVVKVGAAEGEEEEEEEDEEEEEEGSDLDAEELLEEERKTAMQKKRATTRAAGQEVVHARMGKKASSRALSDLTASYDDMALSTSSRQRRSRPARRSSLDPRLTTNASRSPAAPRKAPPKLVRTHRSSSSMRSAGDDEADEEEDNLWPAASATSKSGTPRPRHILVNLPGGPGIWDSKTGGGRNAVAAINTVAAARAKAIKKRAKDPRTSFELPPNWDDEMMDYGWPRSLKGSLY